MFISVGSYDFYGYRDYRVGRRYKWVNATMAIHSSISSEVLVEGGVYFQNFDFLLAFSIYYNPPIFQYCSNSFKFIQILGKFELFRQNFPPTPIYQDPPNV